MERGRRTRTVEEQVPTAHHTGLRGRGVSGYNLDVRLRFEHLLVLLGTCLRNDSFASTVLLQAAEGQMLSLRRRIQLSFEPWPLLIHLRPVKCRANPRLKYRIQVKCALNAS